ncbi:MAG: response regulator [Rhodospirillales bacterium]
MNVLLVDDDPVSRETIKLFLQTKLCHVEEAAGGKQAVIEALRVQPDLILMDLIMPDMDGVEAIRILKSMSWTKTIKFFAITASEKPDLHDAALEAGADVVLGKPFDLEEFGRLAGIA